jgi:hypothetical protein
MPRLIIGIALLVALVLPSAASAKTAPTCQFQFGFAILARTIPEQVGNCVDDEQHNPVNGDALQHTTGGLLVWRKADNWTAFTDGYRTWVNGPAGLQERLNTKRFTWEAIPTVVRVKAGEPYTDHDGKHWDSDVSFVSTGLASTNVATTTRAIAGTSDPSLYRSERHGLSFVYTFVVLNGSYTLTLKFAEIYWTYPGQRRFSVVANGQRLLTAFDILSLVPPNSALDRSFPVTATDETISVAFTAVTDEAKVAALQLAPS